VKRISLILVALLAALSCQSRPVRMTAVAPDQSRLNVYLQPFQHEQGGLEFLIRSVSLVREDGQRLPLILQLDRISGAELDRERLLASGGLPPGAFVGLDVAIEAASFGPSGARSTLTVDPVPARVDLPFNIGRRRGAVVSLRFHPKDSVGEGFAFHPVFSGEVPVRPPSGVVALASSRADDTVVLFDKISGRVVGVVPTGRQPAGMALSESRRRAYVAITGDDSIEVIGIDEQDIIERLRLQGGDAPLELALTPDGRTLLSANSGSDSVSFIDTNGPFEIERVSVGNAPNSILIDRFGRRAYVFNSLGDSITILDLLRRTVVGTIRTESEPLRGQFSPDGERLYVIHRSSPNMLIVDPATMSITDRVYVRSGASALKIDSRTGWIYLARRTGGVVEVFEPDSFLPVGTISTPGAVNYLTIDGDTGNLFCVLPRSPAVRSISIASQRALVDTDLGADPYWVTMIGER